MTPIQNNKRKLEQELKQLIDRFHQENEGYYVTYISVKSTKMTDHRKNEISIRSTNVETNIEVI